MSQFCGSFALLSSRSGVTSAAIADAASAARPIDASAVAVNLRSDMTYSPCWFGALMLAPRRRDRRGSGRNATAPCDLHSLRDPAVLTRAVSSRGARYFVPLLRL